MRAMAFGLSGACLMALLAACGATSTEGSSGSGASADTRLQPEIGELAFIVWTCADLECLNLETSESSTHTYTACSALLEDAQSVGVSICEGRRISGVVSSPATCTPLGTQCPNARLAYNWDDTNKKRVDDTQSDAGVASDDAGVP